MKRLLPTVPEKGKKLRLLIDTDAANEIDDLYAIALAILSEKRFSIEGFVATHFAASVDAGHESIDKSYCLIQHLLESAGMKGKYPVLRGGDPMQYQRVPSESEGCDFIISRAHEGSEDDPLWVLILGAPTNPASAILKDPSIQNKVRFIFHARSEHTWPAMSEQYNVRGDVLATMALLSSGVPLVWFDTGTHITASFDATAQSIAPYGELGKFLHEYRAQNDYWMTDKKGFFDLGDVAWLLEPSICQVDVEKVMTMDQTMRFFRHEDKGEMLRVHDIDCSVPWELLQSALKKKYEKKDRS